MKKTLNEEVSRIKSIMGCCKGKLNEDQENCIDPESEQGQQEINKAVGYVGYEIKQLGLASDDISTDTKDTPEISDAKQKLTDMLESSVSEMDAPQLKDLIMGVKRLIRDRKAGKVQDPKQAEVNEQIGSAAAVLSQVEIFLLALPTGVFVAVAVWLLLRFVRCYVYKFVRNATGSFCGLNTVTNPFNRVLQLVFLDFRNLFSGWQSGTQDNYVWGCERWYRR